MAEGDAVCDAGAGGAGRVSTPGAARLGRANASASRGDLEGRRLRRDDAVGGGDKDLGVRLANSGVRGQHLRFTAPLVHLDHPRGYADPAPTSVRTGERLRARPASDGVTWGCRTGWCARERRAGCPLHRDGCCPCRGGCGGRPRRYGRPIPGWGSRFSPTRASPARVDRAFPWPTRTNARRSTSRSASPRGSPRRSISTAIRRCATTSHRPLSAARAIRACLWRSPRDAAVSATAIRAARARSVCGWPFRVQRRGDAMAAAEGCAPSWPSGRGPMQHSAGRRTSAVCASTLWASDLRVTVLTPRQCPHHFDPVAWFLRGERPAILHMNRFHPTKRRAVHALSRPGCSGAERQAGPRPQALRISCFQPGVQLVDVEPLQRRRVGGRAEAGGQRRVGEQGAQCRGEAAASCSTSTRRPVALRRSPRGCRRGGWRRRRSAGRRSWMEVGRLQCCRPGGHRVLEEDGGARQPVADEGVVLQPVEDHPGRRGRAPPMGLGGGRASRRRRWSLLQPVEGLSRAASAKAFSVMSGALLGEVDDPADREHEGGGGLYFLAGANSRRRHRFG